MKKIDSPPAHQTPELASDTAQNQENQANPNDRLRRWRLVLGQAESDSAQQQQLSTQDQQLDAMLQALYNSHDNTEPTQQGQAGGLGASAPRVARWLGDIRDRFPSSVVRVMQKDAFDRLDLKSMLLQPEMLETIEPDIHMVSNLINLSHLVPDESKDTARLVVKRLVDELMQRIKSHTEQTLRGSLQRAMRKQRPLPNDIDWGRTILANLKHYQPELKTVIPERLIGYGRKKPSTLKEIVLCVDQSGSMASSVIYASIFAAVMASIPALKTQLVVFDTSVIDLTDQLTDPVDVLFGIQLGGGTDINSAVAYCQKKITKAKDTSLILITDLYEGGNKKELISRVADIQATGTQVITLLALNDDGAPYYDKQLAQTFANLNIPTFACTPDKFPDLMACSLNDGDIQQWAAKEDLVLTRHS